MVSAPPHLPGLACLQEEGPRHEVLISNILRTARRVSYTKGEFSHFSRFIEHEQLACLKVVLAGVRVAGGNRLNLK